MHININFMLVIKFVNMGSKKVSEIAKYAKKEFLEHFFFGEN